MCTAYATCVYGTQVRAKLCAAFEDCLSDTMDQLWGALQYAGSRHALVERMKQVRGGVR